MTAVLEAIGMEKRFPVKQQMLLRRRDTFQALQGIDLALYSGQTLGVVGESGSGKSTLGEIFGDLQQPTSGIVRYKGQDIRSLGEKEYRRFRRNVQYIFQNPKESMNPYYTVERILVEPMKILVDGFKPHKARETVREMLNRVGLPDSTLGKYPSELLKDLQKEFSTAYLFISHDIGVIHYMSDFIVVINRGRIVEQGEGSQLIRTPKDDYTKRLIASSCSTGEGCVCGVR